MQHLKTTSQMRGDVCAQGYSVLSADLDAVLLRDPLDRQVCRPVRQQDLNG
jgi:hypothetical protein